MKNNVNKYTTEKIEFKRIFAGEYKSAAEELREEIAEQYFGRIESYPLKALVCDVLTSEECDDRVAKERILCAFPCAAYAEIYIERTKSYTCHIYDMQTGERVKPYASDGKLLYASAK